MRFRFFDNSFQYTLFYIIDEHFGRISEGFVKKMSSLSKRIVSLATALAAVLMCAVLVPSAFAAQTYTVDYVNGDDIVYTQSSSLPGISVCASDIDSSDGSMFLGWVSDLSAIESVYHKSNSFDIRGLSTYDETTRHACVYALWQECALDSFYARFDDPNLYEDQACTKRVEVKIPSYPGYEFCGWFAEPECKTLVITSAGQFAGNEIDGYVSSMGWAMTQNTTLYAGWREVDGSTPILAFDGDMDDLDAPCAYSILFTVSDDVPAVVYASSSIEAFYKMIAPSASDLSLLREGYVFIGWNTQDDATGKMYYSGDEILLEGISGGSSELVLYPIWEVQSPLISFTIDGKVYQAASGMDWKTWVQSKYNTGDYVIISCDDDSPVPVSCVAVLGEDGISVRILFADSTSSVRICTTDMVCADTDYVSGVCVFKVLEAPWLGGDPPPGTDGAS